MSHTGNEATVRTCPDTLARGLCMDCHQEFAGPLYLLGILHEGKLGMEVGVTQDGQCHALTRTLLCGLPTVEL